MPVPRDALRGDIWVVDLGIAAKVRPCLLLTDFPREDELALFTIVPHTTALKGNRWEVPVPKPFLAPGAFHLQQVQSVSVARLERFLGRLTETEFAMILGRLSERLFRS